MRFLTAAFAIAAISFGQGMLSAKAADASAPATAASIPFASRNIFTWQADDENGIWIQTINRKWYYGTFMSRCDGLEFREGVHFKFAPGGELDRWGSIIIPHVPECFFKTFTVSDGPPSPKKANPPAVTPLD